MSFLLKYKDNSIEFNIDDQTTIYQLKLKILLIAHINPFNQYILYGKDNNNTVIIGEIKNNDDNLIKYLNLNELNENGNIITVNEIIDYNKLFQVEKKEMEQELQIQRNKILYNTMNTTKIITNEIQEYGERLFFKVFRFHVILKKIMSFIKYDCCGGEDSNCTHNSIITYPTYHNNINVNNTSGGTGSNGLDGNQSTTIKADKNYFYYNKSQESRIDILKEFRSFNEITDARWMVNRGYIQLLIYKLKKCSNQIYNVDKKVLYSLIECQDNSMDNEVLSIIKYLYQHEDYQCYLFSHEQLSILQYSILKNNLQVFQFLLLSSKFSQYYLTSLSATDISSLFENSIKNIGINGGNNEIKCKIIYDTLLTIYPLNCSRLYSFGKCIDIASEYGLIEIVKSFLTINPNIDFGYQALDMSATNGHYETVKFLTKHTKTNITQYSLFGASLNGHLGIIEYLLLNFKDVLFCQDNVSTKRMLENIIFNSIDGNHFQIFEKFVNLLKQYSIIKSGLVDHAVIKGRFEMVKYLIDNGHSSENGIELAASIGNLDIVKLLMPLSKKTTLPLQVKKPTSSAVNLASECGFYDVVKYLLDNYAPLSMYAGEWSAYNGYFEIVKLLSPTKDLSNSSTNHAASGNQYEIVEYLCKHGHIGTPNAFIVSASNGYLKILKLLFKYHKSKIPIDVSTISRICEKGHLSTLKFLNSKQHFIENVKEPGVPVFSNDAMDRACRYGNFEIVKYLHFFRRQDGYSSKSLSMASAGGFQVIVEFLLAIAVSSISSVIQSDQSISLAIKEASRYNRIEILKLLIPHFAESNRSLNVDAINISSEYNNYQCVELLIENGFNYSHKAIDMASLCGNFQIVKYLIELDRSVGFKEAFNNSSQKGYVQILKYLLSNNITNTPITNTTFIKSSKNGHYQIIELLLNQFYNNNNPTMVSFITKDDQITTLTKILQDAVDQGNEQTLYLVYNKIGLNLLMNCSITTNNIKIVNLNVLKFIHSKLKVDFTKSGITAILKNSDCYYVYNWLNLISGNTKIVRDAVISNNEYGDKKQKNYYYSKPVK